MVNIYIGKSNIPKDKKYINDADKFCFGGSLRVDDDFTKMILKEIEKGEILSEYLFKDRFGFGLYVHNLSTGTKAILAAKYFPEYVINLTEAGRNVLEFVSELGDANIYLNRVSVNLHKLSNPICLNGVLYNNLDELNDAILECDKYVKY